MRAGKLDRSIAIQRETSTVNDYGTPVKVWAEIATVRAEIVQASTEEFIRGWGASDEALTIFRIRWMDGITNADRIVYAGRNHNIKEITEIGRRRGLEIRTVGLAT